MGQDGFTWGTPFDKTALRAALAAVFPADERARHWLEQAVRSFNEVYRVTSVIQVIEDGWPPEPLHFSLAEALYARGFTNAEDIAALSLEDFTYALLGTFAYKFAAAIYTKAGGPQVPPVPEPGNVQPINPDGTLVDCRPPCELSPLGPIAYLHGLLGVSTAATCNDPSPESESPESKAPTIGDLVSKLRGRSAT